MKYIKLFLVIYFTTLGTVFLMGAILQVIHGISSVGSWIFGVILLTAGRIVAIKLKREEDL